MRDLTLSIRINGQRAAADMRRFTDSARGSLGHLRGEARKLQQDFGGFSTAAKLFAAGGGFLAGKKILQDSANLDKQLIRIKQTAGLTTTQMLAMRNELFAMSKETGVAVDDLVTGLNSAVASGLDFNQALPVMKAVNKAVAVTGANTDTLVNGLGVAATAFNFDLSKPAMAGQLLDKMAVAGRLGNAELENLSDIFARIGVNANSAGLGFDKTLGFIEALSKIEKNPERLATLADSTLRVFTNRDYMKAASKATGVAFFDKKGGSRDPVAVLKDIKAQYAKLTTDAKRSSFIDAAFGNADLDTIKGIKTLLSSDNLDNIDQFSQTINQASGTISKDLPEALHNAVDQADRLKAIMGKAADAFAQPINETFTTYALKVADNANVRNQLLTGLAGAGGLYLLNRFNTNRKNRLAGESATLAESAQAALANKVFVTNWPSKMLTTSEQSAANASAEGGDSGGALNDLSGSLGDAGAARGDTRTGRALSRAGKALGAAGAAFSGWQIGQEIGGVAKELIDATVQTITNDESATLGTALYDFFNKSEIDTGGELKISIDDNRARVTQVKANDPRTNIKVSTGLMMPGAG